MKYFVKAIPVDGKPTENDLILTEKGKVIHYEYGFEGFKIPFKKVKLFLCSRDIQVGDLAHYDGVYDLPFTVCKKEPLKDVGQWGTLKDITNKHFKIIGEISPDALSYVKEGGEFDESEIKKFGLFRVGKDLHRVRGDTSPLYLEGFIYEIKGPCGHFH